MIISVVVILRNHDSIPCYLLLGYGVRWDIYLVLHLRNDLSQQFVTMETQWLLVSNIRGMQEEF